VGVEEFHCTVTPTRLANVGFRQHRVPEEQTCYQISIWKIPSQHYGGRMEGAMIETGIQARNPDSSGQR
jgi:hypothetical protein